MGIFNEDFITIAGCAAKPAEMRYTQNGRAITKFSVPIDRSYKKDGQWINRTIWYNITVFGNYAETVNERVHKDTVVLVTGKLSFDEDTGGPRIWQGDDGQHRSQFEVIADTVRFLGVRQTESSSAPAQQEEDEIPW